MRRLPTTLLEHTLRDGRHFDWMIADPLRPGDPDALLWTARCPWPTDQWAAAGNWLVEVLPPHRRAFLTWQGPVSGDRGVVRRVDEGHALVQRWTDSVCVVEVAMRRFHGCVTLTHVAADRWRAASGPSLRVGPA